VAAIKVTNISGLNLYLNPLLKSDGELLRAVNVESYPLGAKRKRSGYIKYLGTADGSAPTTLFSWTKNDGTTLFNYRASGTQLYYSKQGTAAWAACGNGGLGAGAHVGHAVLDDTLIIGDGVGSTRHTTNGTSFTNTTLAPVGEFFAQYQNRIYIGGTSSTLFYSTTGDATNWSGEGTADSSSLSIPGAGKINSVIKCNDRLVTTKNSGLMFRWDGYSLVDISTNLGPASPYSVDSVEGYYFWLNRLGHFGYGGDKPQLLSNAIQPQIYNDAGEGIAGTAFTTAPGGVHRYDYLLSIGTVTDDITDLTVKDAILKYNYQKNEYLNYQFSHFPTAYHSFKNSAGNQQLIFGAAGGQCYTTSGTALTDDGDVIASEMEFAIHLGVPHLEKKWNWVWAFFNPGCQAQVQVAIGNTYRKEGKRWEGAGDASSGLLKFRFPANSRGNFLFVKMKEASKDARFNFYGFVVSADEIQR